MVPRARFAFGQVPCQPQTGLPLCKLNARFGAAVQAVEGYILVIALSPTLGPDNDEGKGGGGPTTGFGGDEDEDISDEEIERLIMGDDAAVADQLDRDGAGATKPAYWDEDEIADDLERALKDF